MQAQYFHKPENVLSRAKDLISVDRKEIALELLHDMLCSRRHRLWQKTHEEIMCLYLRLCVDLKNNRMAKEGLHEYRNISQQQAPGSLQVVIEFMLDLADKRARVAVAHVDTKCVAEVEDLENDTTPESVLLATVTSERNRERKEREFLVPWLKFLWETYRTVLEILRNNPKLEQVYHHTAHKAFAFCQEYERTTEFRRLCEILRTHLTQQQKYGKDPQGNLASETMELHLATRFEQLKVASSLRLWHESFRTIEDIHLIMTISSERPASKLMATYYQKLTSLFLISENFLFHAYAYKALMMISLIRNKSLTKEQKEEMASGVLLAAMSIPLQSSKAGTTFVEEGIEKEKNRRMAQLLGFDINPKRKSLIQDLLSQDILDSVGPQVRELYDALETKFSPNEMLKVTIPILKEIRAHATYNVYAKPLEKLIVVRLVSQLSKVFYSVRLEHFKQLVSELNMPFLEVEKVITKAVKTRQINVRGFKIDHQAGCIRFSEDIMEEKRTRKLLLEMAKGLSTICEDIIPKNEMAKAQVRADLAQNVLSTVAARHREILNRRVEIEKRKEDFEKNQAEKARKVLLQRAEDARIQKELDEKKIQEAKLALQRKREEMQERMMSNMGEKQALLEKGYTVQDIETLGATELQALISKTKEKAEKDMQDAQRKIQTASRRVDALVRAVREKEVPKRQALYKSFVESAKKDYEVRVTEFNAKAVTDHELAIKMRSELEKMQPQRESFESPWVEKWKEEYLSGVEQRNRDRTVQRFQQKIVRARRRRMDTLEAERRRAEEAERARVEEERRLEREEEDRRQALIAAEAAKNAPKPAEPKYRPPASRGGESGRSLGDIAPGDEAPPSKFSGGGWKSGSGAYQPPSARGGDSQWSRRGNDEGRPSVFGGGSSSGAADSGGSWRRR